MLGVDWTFSVVLYPKRFVLREPSTEQGRNRSRARDSRHSPLPQVAVPRLFSNQIFADRNPILFSSFHRVLDVGGNHDDTIDSFDEYGRLPAFDTAQITRFAVGLATRFVVGEISYGEFGDKEIANNNALNLWDSGEQLFMRFSAEQLDGQANRCSHKDRNFQQGDGKKISTKDGGRITWGAGLDSGSCRWASNG